ASTRGGPRQKPAELPRSRRRCRPSPRSVPPIRPPPATASSNVAAVASIPPRAPRCLAPPSRTPSWGADDKGGFMLGDCRYCYPLTITDFASRYLLTCGALSTTQEEFASPVFERTFTEFGLPQTIRTDNGVPFASAHALYGLSKLSVLAAPPRHPHRAHPTPTSPAKWPPRMDASHAEDGGHQARGRQCAPVAGPIRHLPPAL